MLKVDINTHSGGDVIEEIIEVAKDDIINKRWERFLEAIREIDSDIAPI